MPRPAGLLLAILLLLCRPVAAQPSDADKAAAKIYAREGNRLFEEGKYREAIDSFSKAYGIRPHFLVQCNIARCHELLGELARAAEHYRRCLNEGGEKTDVGPQAKKALAEVEKTLAARQAASQPASKPAPPPPPPPRKPPPPIIAAPRGRPFFLSLGVGAGIELKDLSSQLKLLAGFGYHFSRASSGPALALDAQVGVKGGFTSIEAGPRFSWDLPLAPAYGLYASPGLTVGFAHLTGACVGTICGGSESGITAQLGAEVRLLLSGRGLVFLRPISIDLLALSGGGSWHVRVRYDLLFGGGAVF